MKIQVFIFTALLLILSACQMWEPTINPTFDPTRVYPPTTTPTSVTILPATTTNTPLPTVMNTPPLDLFLSPTQELKTPEASLPDVIQIEPKSQCLGSQYEYSDSLIDLELSVTDRLLLQANPPPQGVFRIGLGETSVFIPNTDVEADERVFFQGISPDGLWMAFSKWDVNSQYSDLWISSIDGDQQWVATVLELETQFYAHWVDKEHILISTGVSTLYPENGVVINPISISLLNPFTKVIQLLPSLPTGVRPLSPVLTPLGNNTTYGFYYANGHFYLYDYVTGQTELVFTWLSELVWSSSNPNLYGDLQIRMTTANLFDLIVIQPYGLDVALNLSLEQARESSSYQTVMQAIRLPADGLETRFLNWIPGQKLIAIERYEPFPSMAITNQFYILDVENQILYDYCLDRGVGSSYLSHFPEASENGQFLAWTFADELNHPLGVAVLNLASGRIIHLDGWTLLGWAKIE